MKNLFLFSLLLCLLVSCDSNVEQATEIGQKAVASVEKAIEKKKQLRHVVLFKFKETATPEEVQQVEAAFIALPSKISQIKDFEWGLNNSPEGLNKGLTHCFFVTFDSEEDRAIYLPHPAHKAFVDVLSPHLEDVLVVDYWAGK